MAKCTRLLSKTPTARLLARAMDRGKWKLEHPDKTTFRNEVGGKVGGGKRLHESAAYAPAFCRAILASWGRHFNRF
eukprot:449233-Pyramimonas_sp.AAC.1